MLVFAPTRQQIISYNHVIVIYGLNNYSLMATLKLICIYAEHCVDDDV